MLRTIHRPAIDRLLHQTRSSARRPVAHANDNAGIPVSWGQSTVAGRGLFATGAFAPGCEIVCSPAHDVSSETLDALVSPYAFAVDRSSCTGVTQFALVFGPVSLANHSDEPNAAVTFTRTPERGLEAHVTALLPIAAGDEIFICYPDRHRYQPAGWF